MSRGEATASPAETVAQRLEHYARRGIFRGFSLVERRGSRSRFRIRWHYDRTFDCVLDPRRATLRFPVVLPNVPPRSSMDRDLRAFVRRQQSDEMLEHRRISPERLAVSCVNRGGDLGIALKVKDGDYDYATMKLVHLVHEVFLVFLYDGRYYDYLVETFDVDPDHE